MNGLTKKTDAMTQLFYLGVIPARSGSKRIPDKNLASLNGRPLIDYTLQAARESCRLGAFVVSTDSEAIAAHARAGGGLVPGLRPATMAGDRSPVLEALLHALSTYEQVGGTRADAIVLLQPTSPFRTGTDIDHAIEIFERTGADTVTAVREARDHPYWAWRDRADAIAPYFTASEMTMDRKDLPTAYAESGAAYVVRRALVEEGRLYGERVVPCIMDELHAVDIDTPLDLAWAEFLLQRGMVTR